MKRVLSLLLVFSMLASYLPMFATAAQVEETTEGAATILSVQETVQECKKISDQTYTRKERTDEVMRIKQLQRASQGDSAPAAYAIGRSGGERTFETYEDLKALAEESYGQMTFAKYVGTEPVVVEEDLYLPENLSLSTPSENFALVIPEDVVFSTSNSIQVDSLKVEGEAYIGGGFVYEELEVTGTLYNSGYLNTSAEIPITGLENVEHTSEWAYLVAERFITSMADLHEGIALAATSESYLNYIHLYIEKPFTITQTVTLPECADLIVLNGASLKIQRGCTVTLQGYIDAMGPVTVDGTLDNQGVAYITVSDWASGKLIVSAGGSYQGSGELIVGSDILTDYSSAISGLDLSDFDVSSYEYEDYTYWSLKCIEDLPRLPAPTDLEWGYNHDVWAWDPETGGEYTVEAVPGYISWKSAVPTLGDAWIQVYQEGSSVPVYTYSWGFDEAEEPVWRSIDSLINEDLPSGRYYFTVTSEGDYEDYASSEPAVSDIWTYTRPSKQVAQCTDLVWNWPGIRGNFPANDPDICGYEAEFWYAETQTGEKTWFLTSWSRNCDGVLETEIDDYALERFGEGYYYFRVRALSKDITQACNGPWSEFSEGFYFDGDWEECGHNFEEWTVIQEPTCLEDGLEESVCTECGYVEREILDATGHDFGNWTVIEEPTCEEPGLEEGTCSQCGETEQEELDPIDHSYGQPAFTWTDANRCTAAFTCENCQEAEVVECDVTKEERADEIIYTAEAEFDGETYTDEKSVPVQEDQEPVLWGDVNRDGWVDSFDASLIMKYDVMLVDESELDMAAADVSNDGWVDSYDASLILKYDVFLLLKFPADPRCLVVFESNGGSAVGHQLVNPGETAEKPQDPSRVNAEFQGWYSDEALTQEFDFDAELSADTTVYAKWLLLCPLKIEITNSGYQSYTQSLQTESGSVTLTGKVTGEGELKQITAVYYGYGQEETVAQITGAEEWSMELPLQIGTNTVKITAVASDDTYTEAYVYVNRISTEISYSDSVKVADREDFRALYNDIVGVWTDENGTELAGDDTIVMLVSENALLLSQIRSGLLAEGEVYMIPENDLFELGFSGIYNHHRAPRGSEDYPVEEYPDSQYEEIVFEYPSFADIFGEDISLDLSGINTSDPIAFAVTGDGTPFNVNSGNSSFLLYNAPALASNTYYGKPGWQFDQLLTNILPSLDVNVDRYNRLNLQLKWDDVVIYDDDGQKNPDTGLDKDKGQLKLSGEVGVTNLKYTGGMEWHPSLVPWDVELLPQQIMSKMEYTYGGGLTLKGGASVSTEELIKSVNKFDNKKEFWGMDVNGVKTFNSKLVLGIVGLNLPSFTVKPYKTMKGLAASSSTTCPKLFLYVYLDMDGNVSIEGSMNLKYSTNVVKGYNVQKNGYTGSYGSQAQNRSDKHYSIGSTHTLDIYDVNNNNGGLTLNLAGKFEYGLDIGPGVGAGLMICGVCPATVDGEMFYRAKGLVEGEFQVLPEFKLEGYANIYQGIGVQADIAARVIVKTKIGDAGFNAHKHFEYMFWEETHSTGALEGTVYVSDDDGNNSNNQVIEGATLTLTKNDSLEQWTATSEGNGTYRFINIPDGEYTLKVEKFDYDSYVNENLVFEKEKKLDIFLNEKDPWDGICTLSGKIVVADKDTDLTNNDPLGGATIELRNLSNDATLSTTTASNGTYSFDRLPAGNYAIAISKEGYISIYAAVSVADNVENHYNATMEAISTDYEGDGKASGTVYDALNGNEVADLTIRFRGGVNASTGDIVETVTTDDNGFYETPFMPAGNYTAEIVDERELSNEDARYSTTTFTVKILGGETIPNQDGFVTNGLKADQLRIVLKWGENPSDLDSYLVGPAADGDRFYTAYYRMEHYEGDLAANLDLDDTDSFGPETSTIYQMEDGIYTFMVHDYTNGWPYMDNYRDDFEYCDAMANSGAYVEVFVGNSREALYRFDVPNKEGLIWTVFSYNSITGEILPINKVEYGDPGEFAYNIPVRETATFSLRRGAQPETNAPVKDYVLAGQQSVAATEETVPVTEAE